jgi:3-methyl-2-oxobutanoate hydroxymethyltransferase
MVAEATTPRMSPPLTRKLTLNDLRRARDGGAKFAMLTCYDYTTARLMQEAGVPALLVGDSASNVVLGYPTTLPVSLSFMIEITAAVRRGAPLAFLVADMPFGSYQGSVSRGVRNVVRMVQRTGCDCVKLEVAEAHLELVRELASAGVAVMAHMGLRPQSVGVIGGYRTQGRTARDARQILALALQMQRVGAAAILLEAVPAEVGKAVVDATRIPVIGCGAGPACHGHVFVTHDAVGLTPSRPRFAPDLGDLATPARAAFAEYVRRVETCEYPAPENQYEMPPEELAKFLHAPKRDVVVKHDLQKHDGNVVRYS